MLAVYAYYILGSHTKQRMVYHCTSIGSNLKQGRMVGKCSVYLVSESVQKRLPPPHAPSHTPPATATTSSP